MESDFVAGSLRLGVDFVEREARRLLILKNENIQLKKECLARKESHKDETERKATQDIKWEYRCSRTLAPFVNELDEYGDDGWELVGWSNEGYATFKRRKFK